MKDVTYIYDILFINNLISIKIQSIPIKSQNHSFIRSNTYRDPDTSTLRDPSTCFNWRKKKQRLKFLSRYAVTVARRAVEKVAHKKRGSGGSGNQARRGS